MTDACDDCLARTWLLVRLSGHIETVRGRLGEVLALDAEALVPALAGRERPKVSAELAAFDPGGARERCRAAGLELLCRCDDRYPPALHALAAPPAVLHVAGGLDRFLSWCDQDPVAVVGARRASEYGLGLAAKLGRGLGRAGLPVVSGMAFGIDSAAHDGALKAAGATIAVLPGPANRPYPAQLRALHRSILANGIALSEFPPGYEPRRWSFPARNRLIAGLAAMTVVVEAGVRSGALLTAAFADRLRRPVGAVPGPVGSAGSAGPNELLASGGTVVRGPQDVVDRLFGPGTRTVDADPRPPLADAERALLEAIGAGRGTAESLARAGIPPDRGLIALAALELGGYVRRGAGGRFLVIP